MQLIVSQYTNPNANLALEEILFGNKTEEYIVLWQNEPCIVLGKHQVLAREVNLPIAHRLGIPVCRRLSGGGTVFQDAGNLNFTFILNATDGLPVKFRTYMQPILDYLLANGVPAAFSPRNDILADGFKVSGNAEHVRSNRVIHHGTLLFDADLKSLNGLLHHQKARYTTKGIQSVSSSVTNISNYWNISFDGFKNGLVLHLLKYFDLERKREVLPDEYEKCCQLASEKYLTPDWIFARSPEYTFRNELEDGGFIEFFVKNGRIERMQSNMMPWEMPEVHQTFIGKFHIPAEIQSLLLQWTKNESDEMLNIFF